MTRLMRAMIFIWLSMLAHEARASLPSRINLFASLPTGASVNAIQVDGNGNVVAAGVIPRSQTASDYDVFVAKFTASGAKVYFTVLSGTGSESATALAGFFRCGIHHRHIDVLRFSDNQGRASNGSSGKLSSIHSEIECGR